jgi:hypothetical protein
MYGALRNTYRIYSQNLRETGHLGDIAIDGRIIHIKTCPKETGCGANVWSKDFLCV